jgi:hypothetical protein
MFGRSEGCAELYTALNECSPSLTISEAWDLVKHNDSLKGMLANLNVRNNKQSKDADEKSDDNSDEKANNIDTVILNYITENKELVDFMQEYAGVTPEKAAKMCMLLSKWRIDGGSEPLNCMQQLIEFLPIAKRLGLLEILSTSIDNDTSDTSDDDEGIKINDNEGTKVIKINDNEGYEGDVTVVVSDAYDNYNNDNYDDINNAQIVD